MATNIQIGLAYAIGAIGNECHKLVHLDEVLGENYKPYVMTMHEGIRNNNTYVLFKNLTSKTDYSKLAEMDTRFSLTQVIHIFEEVIAYDLKMKKN